MSKLNKFLFFRTVQYNIMKKTKLSQKNTEIILTKEKQSAIMCKVICFTVIPEERAMHEKQVEIGYLLDFYGDLLSERRRTVLDMYYNEDMSLSEISDSLGITRQGALDQIKKAGNELLLYEEKLKMADKFRIISECAEKASQLIEKSASSDELAALLRRIIETINS